MKDIRKLLLSIVLCACSPLALAADAPGHITGVGGVFFKSKDPKALMAWYRDVLGIKLEPWGGAMMRYDAPGHPPMVVVAMFDPAAQEFDPSKREFMLNFAVDDLSAFLARLKAKGVTVLKQESDATGKFASILDPDGTKIEFWEPPVKPAAK